MLGFYRVSGLGLRTCIGFLQGLGFLVFRILGLMCLRSQSSTNHKVHK